MVISPDKKRYCPNVPVAIQVCFILFRQVKEKLKYQLGNGRSFPSSRSFLSFIGKELNSVWVPLPTQHILWFYENWLQNLERYLSNLSLPRQVPSQGEDCMNHINIKLTSSLKFWSQWQMAWFTTVQILKFQSLLLCKILIFALHASESTVNEDRLHPSSFQRVRILISSTTTSFSNCSEYCIIS